MNEISIEEFAKVVAENIRKHLPEENRNVNIRLDGYVKNNDMRLHGLLIMDAAVNAAPVIYLESFYKDYLAGKDIGQIMDDIADTYMQHRAQESIEVSSILSYEKVKDNLICQLRGIENNQSYLTGKVYTQVEDMAVTYHVLLDKNINGSIATATVTEQMLQSYGVDKQELHQTAMENTLRIFPVEFVGMSELLRQMLPPDAQLPVLPEQEAMYVLTNTERLHGAVGILDPETMERVGAVVGDGFYVLPSSIHEVIILSSKDFSEKELEEMVQDVNRTQLSPDEVLTNHVYRANLKEHRLVRCETEQMMATKEIKRNQQLSPKKKQEIKGPKL